MDYDFIIIGTGPSGSVVGSNLAKKGYKIAMVDRATNIKKNSDTNSFIFSPYIKKSPFNYTPLFSNQLGGNSALWHNKIYLLSKKEFNTENWGFNYNELKKNSKDLSKKLKLDHKKINHTFIKDKFNYSKSLRATKLGNLFHYLNINSFNNIDIFTHSSPIKIIFDKTNNAKKLIIKNLTKKDKITLKVTKSIIFCAGGLGNPNILQNLIKSYNQNIGKNLCDHPHLNLGNFDEKSIKKSLNFSKYFFNKNTYLENNLFIKKDNQFAGIQLDLSGDTTKIIKKIYCKINMFVPRFLLSILITYYSLFIKILDKCLSVINIKNKYTYEFFFSQRKNYQNQVKLNKYTKDRFNNFKSDISWNISKKEESEYNKFIDQLIGKNGSFIKTNNKYAYLSHKILSGLHPSCTTQISNNKKEGCVDKNLKIIDFKNLYICGSSVFKINGFTNPTWTIMALANRLSKHLDKKYKYH